MSFSLGEINYKLGADTSSLKASVAALEKFEAAHNAMANSAAKDTDKTASAFRAQTAAVSGALQQTLNFNKAVRDSGGRGGAVLIRDQNRAFQQLSKTLTGGVVSANTYNAAMINFRNEMGKSNRALRNHKKAAKEAALADKEVGTSLRDLSSAAVLVAGPLSGIGARMASFTSIATRTNLKIAAVITSVSLLALAFGLVSRGVVKASIDMQRFEKRLNVIAGMTGSTASQLLFIKQTAEQAGQAFQVSAEQFSKFVIAAKRTPLEGAAIRKIFKEVSLVSGVVQSTVEETAGIFKALEQMLSKGIVQAEELRGQLGDRLVGAFKIAASSMGVTTEELNKMLKAGEVIAEDFLPKFTAELLRFYNLNENDRVESLTADLNRLSTSFFDLKIAVDDTFKISTAFSATLQMATKGLIFLSKNMQTFKTLLLASGAAMIAFTSVKHVKKIKNIAKAIWGMVVAIKALNFAALKNPLALLSASSAPAIAAMVAFSGVLLLSTLRARKQAQANKDLLASFNEYVEASGLNKGTSAYEEDIKQLKIGKKLLDDFIMRRARAMDFKPTKGPGIGDALGDALGVELASKKVKEMNTAIFDLVDGMRKLDGRTSLEDALKGATEEEIARVKNAVDIFGELSNLIEKLNNDKSTLTVIDIKALTTAEDAIKEFMETLEELETRTKLRDEGFGQNYIDSVIEVNKVVGNLSKGALQELNNRLSKMGLVGDNATQTLIDLVLKTKQAKDAAKDHAKAEKARAAGIKTATATIKALQDKTAAMVSSMTSNLSLTAKEFAKLSDSIKDTTALDEFNAKLVKAGIGGQEATRLLSLFTVALEENRKAQEDLAAEQEIRDAFVDADGAVKELIQNFQRLVSELDAAGRGEDAYTFVVALNQANDILKDLDGKALQELEKQLQGVKIEGDSTAETLAKLIIQNEKLKNNIDEVSGAWNDNKDSMTGFNEAFRDVTIELEFTRGRLAALMQGGIEASKEWENLFKDTQFMENLRDEMESMNIPLAKINEDLAKMAEKLAIIRGLNNVYAKQVRDLRAFEEVVNDIAGSFSSFVEDIINGNKSLVDSFRQLLKDLAAIALDEALLKPLRNLIRSIFGVANQEGSKSILSAIFSALAPAAGKAGAGGAGLSKGSNLIGGLKQAAGGGNPTVINFNSTFNAQGANKEQLQVMQQQLQQQQEGYKKMIPRIIDQRVVESSYRRRINV